MIGSWSCGGPPPFAFFAGAAAAVVVLDEAAEGATLADPAAGLDLSESVIGIACPFPFACLFFACVGSLAALAAVGCPFGLDDDEPGSASVRFLFSRA